MPQTTKRDDDDDDSDFVPPDDGVETDSGSENFASPKLQVNNDNGFENKQHKAKTESVGFELWSQFKESALSSVRGTDSGSPMPPLVKVVKTYRYAGEEVVQIVEVPADSEDAKSWPKAENQITFHPSEVPGPADLISITTSSADTNQEKNLGPTSSVAKKRRAPVRSRKTLGDIPSAKLKKLSTLDKSLMDWDFHLNNGASQSVKDDLEAHRKGGGFIEKVEFMERVSERRDEERRGSSSKRRRL